MYFFRRQLFEEKKWLREATNDAHNRLAIPNVPGSSMRERVVVVKLVLHTLAGINVNLRETLEYIK